MRDFINGVFWLTSIVYGITIFTVPYVGVYLTYVAVPVIVISGLILWLSREKETTISINDKRIKDANATANLLERKIDRLERENAKLNTTHKQIRNSLVEMYSLNERLAVELIDFVNDVRSKGYEVPETMIDEMREVQEYLSNHKVLTRSYDE
ncbi:hypothetical protein [Vibrio owensii]|uniref:hypothetical protein n=1 Tax=Vibrio owensii TaxID=696485 RepID=UPI00215C37C5|nr:hypothetical protein [Vibrio owensii]MCR9943218.1 hypothetical protein [Vibrio owensii]